MNEEVGSPDVADTGLPLPTPEDGGEVFASNQKAVVAFAFDEHTLFWANGSPGGRIASCALSGCPSPTLIASGGNPTAVAWSGRLFWSDDQDSAHGVHFTRDGDGGVGTFDIGQASRWVSADTNVYFIENNGEIVRLVGNPPTAITTVFSFSVDAKRLSVHGDALAWTSNDSVHFCGIDGCSTSAKSVVASGQGALAVVLDDTHLYWSTSDGHIRAIARMGNGLAAATVDLAQNLPEPAELSSDPDGAFLYFTARGSAQAAYRDGLIGKVPKTGGAVTVIANGQPRPESIAVTSAEVYWANRYDNTIRRAPK